RDALRSERPRQSFQKTQRERRRQRATVTQILFQSRPLLGLKVPGSGRSISQSWNVLSEKITVISNYGGYSTGTEFVFHRDLYGVKSLTFLFSKAIRYRMEPRAVLKDYEGDVR